MDLSLSGLRGLSLFCNVSNYQMEKMCINVLKLLQGEGQFLQLLALIGWLPLSQGSFLSGELRHPRATVGVRAWKDEKRKVYVCS